jgi:hypothetical protein
MDSEKRISRREMLRNIGIAGAVAWAAPVLTSLPAQASTSANPCKGLNWSCSSVPPPTCCGGAGFCFQKVNAKGGHKAGRLICADLQGNSFCSSFQTCTVGGQNTECPKGFRCTSTCCDQYFNLPYVCTKKCNKPGKGPRKAIGRPTGPSVHMR